MYPCPDRTFLLVNLVKVRHEGFPARKDLATSQNRASVQQACFLVSFPRLIVPPQNKWNMFPFQEEPTRLRKGSINCLVPSLDRSLPEDVVGMGLGSQVNVVGDGVQFVASQFFPVCGILPKGGRPGELAKEAP